MTSVSSNVEVDAFPPIREVEIENFKSIKHLELECKRINVFIGEPNTGKSNIIEAIVGFPCSVAYEFKLQNAIRFERLSNLFYDEIIERNIRIDFKKYELVGILSNCEDLKVALKSKGWTEYELRYYLTRSKKEEKWKWGYPEFYDRKEYENISKWLKRFKFYRFMKLNKYPNKSTEFLAPPMGDNLVSVLTKSKELREVANNIVSKFGYKLIVKPREDKLEIQKELEEGVVISFPYTLVSDTIQRIIFYSAVIHTNKNSVIAMEEPEAHAFPYYTKYLAELIALDESNQYFITTHNPYFLLTLIEKTRKEDLAVYITYYENYQTKAKKLSEKKLQEVLDLGSSAFFNLDVLMEE